MLAAKDVVLIRLFIRLLSETNMKSASVADIATSEMKAAEKKKKKNKSSILMNEFFLNAGPIKLLDKLNIIT